MKVLTAAEYRQRTERNPLGNGVFSFLTLEELNTLKMCVNKVMPKWKRKSTYHSLACQPVGAMHFCNAVMEDEIVERELQEFHKGAYGHDGA